LIELLKDVRLNRAIRARALAYSERFDLDKIYDTVFSKVI
jgi:hypothetical protein